MEFTEEYFGDYASSPSPTKVAEQFWAERGAPRDDSMNQSMAARATKPERRGREQRAAEKLKYSPPRRGKTFAQLCFGTPPRTPTKESGSPAGQESEFELKVACATPEVRRLTPMTSPDLRQRPFHQEKTPHPPLVPEPLGPCTGCTCSVAALTAQANKSGHVFRTAIAKELRQNEIKSCFEL